MNSSQFYHRYQGRIYDRGSEGNCPPRLSQLVNAYLSSLHYCFNVLMPDSTTIIENCGIKLETNCESIEVLVIRRIVGAA